MLKGCAGFMLERAVNQHKKAERSCLAGSEFQKTLEDVRGWLDAYWRDYGKEAYEEARKFVIDELGYD